ncbi:TniB family NTP-binding protein [Variovorax sp. LjRoot175]|uniref:TniB family NTP-binding protein n=1 Tax=Variovorax sp. LjRoot175 TaxID=3342276 RepID=UPI003ED02ACE
MKTQIKPKAVFDGATWLEAAVQVLQMAEKFHETPALELFLKRVEYAAMSVAHGLPAEGVWLFGAAGAGKSTALKEACRRLSARPGLRSTRSALLITLLPGPTMYSIVRQLLLALDYPISSSRTFVERVDVLFEAIRSAHVRVIFIDEVQHVCEGNRVAHLREIRDFLKRLVDETNVCLILAGIESAKPLQKSDEQLASRISGELTLRFDFKGNETKAFGRAVLAGSPIPFTADAVEAVLEFLARREGASPRLLVKIGREAIKIAALTKSSTVEVPHVTHAVSLLFLGQPE